VAGGVLVLFRVTLHTSGSFRGQNQLISSSGIKFTTPWSWLVGVGFAIFGLEADIEMLDSALNLDENQTFQEQPEHHFSFKQIICRTSKGSANSMINNCLSNIFPLIQ